MMMKNKNRYILLTFFVNRSVFEGQSKTHIIMYMFSKQNVRLSICYVSFLSPLLEMRQYFIFSVSVVVIALSPVHQRCSADTFTGARAHCTTLLQAYFFPRTLTGTQSKLWFISNVMTKLALVYNIQIAFFLV